jgi:hypothetical protein
MSAIVMTLPLASSVVIVEVLILVLVVVLYFSLHPEMPENISNFMVFENNICELFLVHYCFRLFYLRARKFIQNL